MNVSDLVTHESTIAKDSTPVSPKLRFQPTENWFFEWKNVLVFPLLERMLVELSASDYIVKHPSDYVALLASVVRLKPKSHLPDRVPSRIVRVWLYGFFWGVCFLRHQSRDSVVTAGMSPLWQGTIPRLFAVKNVSSQGNGLAKA